MWHYFASAQVTSEGGKKKERKKLNFIQEMLGLCSYFLGRDTEQFFENAYVYYQKRYIILFNGFF